MFTIYVVGVVLLGMFAAYRYGQADRRRQDEIGAILLAGVIFWPAVLALVIVVAPFGGAVWLGIRSKEKRIEAEKQKEVNDDPK